MTNGKSNVKRYYKYMKSYSPYDNVKPQAIPICIFQPDCMIHRYSIGSQLNGLLRTLKTNNTLLFLDTNMDAGHGGASGRFEAIKECEEFSFY
jgi:oligopeptidase B